MAFCWVRVLTTNLKKYFGKNYELDGLLNEVDLGCRSKRIICDNNTIIKMIKSG